MGRIILLLAIVGLIQGCGYKIVKRKDLRREYFYQFHLGKYQAFSAAEDWMQADREYKILQQIKNETYDGLW